MQHLLRIGQVSKLFGISLDTLRHYDRIGLLKPTVKKDNEYRYYSLKQLEILEMILVGKNMEIPLQQIQESINSESIADYLSMVGEQKKRIIEKKKQLFQIEEFTDNMINQLTTISEFTNDYSFENVTFEEMNKAIYRIELPEMIKHMNFLESVEDLDAIELWMLYQGSSDTTATNMENEHKMCFSFSPILPEPHGLEKQLEIEIEKKAVTLHKISGRYGKVSFWGSYTELVEYLSNLCKQFHLQDCTLSINYQFTMPCKVLENLHFVDIYFPREQ